LDPLHCVLETKQKTLPSVIDRNVFEIHADNHRKILGTDLEELDDLGEGIGEQAGEGREFDERLVGGMGKKDGEGSV